MATKYLDIEGGNDSNDGSSFANRVKTFTKAATLLSPGDTLRVMAAASVVNLGTNLTWIDGSTAVIPESATWVVLDDCESGWTASSNVTLTYPTTFKVGAAALSVAIGASFTTGKAAYKATGTLDLSAYQQLSFWLRLATTSTWPSNISIKLCSDTTGDIPVDTLAIPAGGFGTTSQFNAMLIDKGSAFGNSIQSIAIYVDSDIGAQTIEIDNLVAVKKGTGEISVRHMVGQPNSVGAGGSDNENWFAIRGFTSTQILLDAHWSTASAIATTNYTQRCTAGTLAGKVQPLANIAAPSTGSPYDYGLFYGTSASKITISGGWNRTDMTTQTHHSWMSWSWYNASGQGFWNPNWLANVIWERIHFHQSNSNLTLNFSDSVVGKLCVVMASNCSIYGESSAFSGLYLSSTTATPTFTLVNSTVSDLKEYSVFGLKQITLNGYGSTITAEAGISFVNAVNQNILTSGLSSYGMGYATTLLRRGIVIGTVGSSATTTSIPTSSLSPAAAVTDQFKNRVIVFDRDTATANLRGQVASITGSTSGGTLTVSALTTSPASGDTFMIV